MHARLTSSIVVAAVLATAQPSFGQETDSPPHSSPREAACRAVFEALKGNDDDAFRRSLLSLDRFRAWLETPRMRRRVGEGAPSAEVLHPQLLMAATRGFQRGRKDAAEQFDWSKASFLAEVPIPERRPKEPFSDDRLAFLVFADGKIWQLGSNDAVRDGASWCFASGVELQGRCDPEATARAASAEERLEEYRQRFQREREEMERRMDEVQRARFAAMDELQKKADEFRAEIEISKVRMEAREREHSLQLQQLQEERHIETRRMQREIEDLTSYYTDRLERRERELEAAHENFRTIREELEEHRYESERALRELRLERTGLLAARQRLRASSPMPETDEAVKEALAAPIGIAMQDVSGTELLSIVTVATDCPIVIESEVSYDIEERELTPKEGESRTAMEWLEDVAGEQRIEVRDGVVFVGSSEWHRALRDTANERSTDARLSKRVPALEEAFDPTGFLDSLATSSGLPRWFTPGAAEVFAAEGIYVKSTAPLPVGVILDLATCRNELRWQMLDGILVLATKEDPELPELPRVPDRRVDCDLPEQTHLERLAAWSKAFDLELVLSTALEGLVREELEEFHLVPSFRVDDLKLETAMRLFQLQLGQPTQWRSIEGLLVLGRSDDPEFAGPAEIPDRRIESKLPKQDYASRLTNWSEGFGVKLFLSRSIQEELDDLELEIDPCDFDELSLRAAMSLIQADLSNEIGLRVRWYGLDGLYTLLVDDEILFPALPAVPDLRITSQVPEQRLEERLSAWSKAFDLPLRVTPSLASLIAESEWIARALEMRDLSLRAALHIVQVECGATIGNALRWRDLGGLLVLCVEPEEGSELPRPPQVVDQSVVSQLPRQTYGERFAAWSDAFGVDLLLGPDLIWLQRESREDLSDEHLAPSCDFPELPFRSALRLLQLELAFLGDEGMRWWLVDRVFVLSGHADLELPRLPQLPSLRRRVDLPPQPLVERVQAVSRSFGIELRLSSELREFATEGEIQSSGLRRKVLGLEGALLGIALELGSEWDDVPSWVRVGEALELR